MMGLLVSGGGEGIAAIALYVFRGYGFSPFFGVFGTLFKIGLFFLMFAFIAKAFRFWSWRVAHKDRAGTTIGIMDPDMVRLNIKAQKRDLHLNHKPQRQQVRHRTVRQKRRPKQMLRLENLTSSEALRFLAYTEIRFYR